MEDLHPSDPRIIGPYRTQGRIGTGGMGVVFLVEDASGNRFALKLVRPELADDPAFRARFRREVEAGQRVGGICAARYVDADLDSDHPYLVTEYVEGGNLFDYVTINGPLKGEQLVGLAVGLAEALVAMNAVGVIHRDLKPSNVLMAPKGPKVVDFGISHAADGTVLTQTGNIVGSPGWMAPEQALGRGATASIDVFSWGATVAFAATGRSPFGEGRPDAILYRVVHEDPDLLGLDRKLLPLVTQALQKDPAQRLAADQLLVELVKTAMAGSLPPGGSVAMATVVLDKTWHHDGPRVDAVARQDRRRKGWISVTAFVLIAALIIGGVFALSHSRSTTSSQTTTNPQKHQTLNSTTQSSTAPTTTVAGSSSALVSAVLPMVVCPTTQPNPPTSTVVLPSTISESVPKDLVSQLAIYTDQQGFVKVLAPTGWSCAANYGEDGSGGVQVYPSGQPNPNDEQFKASSDEGIVATQNGGCVGCAVTQASPLFQAANAACESEFAGDPQACKSQPPTRETTEPIESGVVGFLDPPGVLGDGSPSGGTYPANGVMTYQTANYTTSFLETCTLPQSQHSVCTAVLDDFVQLYGTTS